MAGKNGEPRKRKGVKNAKKEPKKKDDDAKEINHDAKTPTEEDTEETVWQTLTSHWLIRYVLPVLAIYAAVQGKWFLQVRILQNPDSLRPYLPSFITLRDPVHQHDPRQLLVVGTMSSGTRQIAASLWDVLGLEMGHEMSDSQTNFVRDGTVSWIFGIRFFEKPHLLDIAKFCQQATRGVGFHPRMYRGDKCSQNKQWSKCWAQECVDLLNVEWGCALPGASGCISFQPHRFSLHQTRKPLAVINSLVSKFCTEKRQEFTRISKLLFHRLDFEEMSCLETVSHHVLEYNRALLRARESGVVHGMYNIEEATPCQVAEMAGLGNASRVIYPPNAVKYETECAASNTKSKGHQSMKPKWQYKVNNNRVRFTWEDFEGGKHGSNRPMGDMTLVEELQELTKALGYSTDA